MRVKRGVVHLCQSENNEFQQSDTLPLQDIHLHETQSYCHKRLFSAIKKPPRGFVPAAAIIADSDFVLLSSADTMLSVMCVSILLSLMAKRVLFVFAVRRLLCPLSMNLYVLIKWVAGDLCLFIKKRFAGFFIPL